MKRLLTAVVTIVLAGLAMVGLATPASAHNALVDSNPKSGTALAAGPSTVSLTFDQPVQQGDNLTSLVVIGPNGDSWQGGDPQVAGSTVNAPLRPLGPAGVYTIGYRILSNDGHPVSGEVKFTLTTAGSGTPAAPADGQPAASDGGLPIWVWIAGAVALLAVGVVLALRVGGEKE